MRKNYRDNGRLDHAFNKAQRAAAVTEQGGVCLYCRRPINSRTATREHRVARKNGGTDQKANIGASCEPCNRLKGHMSEAAFKSRIKHPAHGDDIEAWLAWSRRRVNLAVERMGKHLARATGTHGGA